MNTKITKQKNGSSTVEILIAFAILILSITAVTSVVFGNQSVSVDTETNSEALSMAQKMLDTARAASVQDFVSVVSTSNTRTLGALSYSNLLDIQDISECKKIATSAVSWDLSSLRPQKIKLSTFFTSISAAAALGGDCDTEPPYDWDNPYSPTAVNISGQSYATDINIKNNFVYLTTNPSAAGQEDFFIYEFNPTSMTLAERGRLNTGKGLNAVDIEHDNATGKTYAYVLNNDNSNQLQIIDATIPTSPSQISSISLPNIIFTCSPASSPCLSGRSIFYYNKKIYIGTGYIANLALPSFNNNEFHIFDVSDPTNPIWEGSFNVNHNINKIIVRGNYAYLATSSNNEELSIYNISDPTNISFVGSFDTPGDEDGQALYLLSNKIYLGRVRTPSSRKDFYILDISIPSSPAELGSKNLGLNPNAIVRGIVVRGKLAFLAIDDPNVGLQILNISNPSAIVNHTVCASLNFSENSSAIDMENNFVFVANRSNAEIRVISDQPSACAL